METLLVVDENTTVQRVIELAFKDEPIRVDVVSRGDAFEAIEKHPPDIVLAENGREVSAFVKSRPALSSVPVVLLKGAFDPPASGSDEVGCDGVLSKPLQPHAMVEMVKRLLRQRKRPVARRDPARQDPGEELEKYFDGLAAAFGRTESFAFSPSIPLPTSARPPRLASPPTGPSAAISEELVDEVTRRVVEQLGDRLLRSTATELVARLSKWLIVDEVERTKARK